MIIGIQLCFALAQAKTNGPLRAGLGRDRLIVLAVVLLSSTPLFGAENPISSYQVDLGPPPATVAQALATRPQREAKALAATACGQERTFLDEARTKARDEDVLQKLVAKVAWLSRGESSCSFVVNMPLTFDASAFNNEFTAFFGGDCTRHAVTYAVYEPASEIEKNEYIPGGHIPIPSGHIRATFVISNLCLKQQVNMVVSAMQPQGQIGSSKLPCHLVGAAVEGEWDVSVRDLVRIYYLSLNGTRAPGAQILDPATREHLFNDLLTIDGAPGPDDYPITGCGNTERSTGSPADRADERSWAEENFGWLGDVWDVLKWILLAILIILLILATIFTLGAAAPAWALVPATIAKWAAVAAIALVVVAAVVLSLLRLPETENHLLMINTSRYLTNQIIIAAHPTDVHFFVDDQGKVKQWLLARLQRIATQDFEEYNARPYQRYSITAILNLHDFVPCNPNFQRGMSDCDLKTASAIVLDLATAKFAAGSSEGRRVAPFRRLLEVVEDDIGDRKRLTDANSGSDYMFGFVLAYAGHTSQLPEHKAQFSVATEMIYPATSSYAPAPAVMSVALGEKGVFEQRIHHAGYEIYSRSPSFLISAGGVRTPSATPATLGPFDVGEGCNDRGAALPTVLIPSGGGYLTDRQMTASVRRDDFLRIEGFYYYYLRDGKCLAPNNDAQNGPPSIPADNKDRSHTWSHDNNVCVFKGFACGTNIVVPPTLDACFSPPDGTPWRFLSSATCPALPNTPQFYVALFRKPCPSETKNCLKDWGFFEAVEAPPTADQDAAFAAFRNKVLTTNGAHLTPDPLGGKEPPLSGIYISSLGSRIEFDAAATMNDKNRAGVVAVDGDLQPALNDWPLASGDIVNSDADACPGFPFGVQGRLEITGHQNGVTIDFCNSAAPTRILH
jgi:hypothetical protein